MKSKSIAFALGAVTLSIGSLSFAQGYDHQRGQSHQPYEQRGDQHSGHQQRRQVDEGQRGFERHEQNNRARWRDGRGRGVYVQPAYAQPSYYGGEEPLYQQQGYAQPGYYAEPTDSGDAALAIFAGGLIAQLLGNH